MKRLCLKSAVFALTLALSLAAFQFRRGFQRRQFQTASLLKSEGPKAINSELNISEEIEVEGRYSNFNYAYSALVPKGMMALMNSTPPAPNHGFGIDLTNPQSISWIREKRPPEAAIWVDGSYDSASYGSPSVLIQSDLKWLKEEHQRVRLVTRTATRLGTLRAVRFLIAYQDSGREMMQDSIVAFRSQLGDDSGIIYRVALTTPAARYDGDRARLVEIQRTWIIDPLPDEYPIPPASEGNN